jgi:hypothetical protein
MEQMQSMHARLERLEHRLRATYIGWLITIVVIGVLALGVQQAASQQTGAPQPVPLDVLKTRGLEIVDAAGNVRISLGVSPEGIAEVMLTESSGRARMWFTVRPDGIPSVVLADSSGRGRIWMTAYPDRSSGMIFSDPAGKGRIWLGAGSDGSSNLLLMDQVGRVIFQAPGPSFAVRNPASTVRGSADAPPR